MWTDRPMSERHARLPSGWHSANGLRRRALRRDRWRCQWIVEPGRRCGQRATVVDHIEPMRDDHRLDALQSLCTEHHAEKTSTEGVAARIDANQRAAALRKRPVRRHPGLKDS